jgi:hypothetical protein
LNGTTLKASGTAHFFGAGKSTAAGLSARPVMFPAAAAATCAVSSSDPATPAPEAAWYVDANRRVRPQASCSGFSTGMAAIVVQFGLAMMPFGMFASACAFTSGTTSGTSGSFRQAEELSITSAPASANFGAYWREVFPPAEKKTMSSPDTSAVATSSTTISVSRYGTFLPAERAEAKRRSEASGKSRSANSSRIRLPTRPVAPTTPTWGGLDLEKRGDMAFSGWGAFRAGEPCQGMAVPRLGGTLVRVAGIRSHTPATSREGGSSLG